MLYIEVKFSNWIRFKIFLTNIFWGDYEDDKSVIRSLILKTSTLLLVYVQIDRQWYIDRKEEVVCLKIV